VQAAGSLVQLAAGQRWAAAWQAVARPSAGWAAQVARLVAWQALQHRSAASRCQALQPALAHR